MNVQENESMHEVEENKRYTYNGVCVHHYSLELSVNVSTCSMSFSGTCYWIQKKIELRPHHKIVQQYIYVRSSISSLVAVWGSVR